VKVIFPWKQRALIYFARKGEALNVCTQKLHCFHTAEKHVIRMSVILVILLEKKIISGMLSNT